MSYKKLFYFCGTGDFSSLRSSCVKGFFRTGLFALCKGDDSGSSHKRKDGKKKKTRRIKEIVYYDDSDESSSSQKEDDN